MWRETGPGNTVAYILGNGMASLLTRSKYNVGPGDETCNRTQNAGYVLCLLATDKNRQFGGIMYSRRGLGVEA